MDLSGLFGGFETLRVLCRSSLEQRLQFLCGEDWGLGFRVRVIYIHAHTPGD